MDLRRCKAAIVDQGKRHEVRSNTHSELDLTHRSLASCVAGFQLYGQHT